MKFVFVMNIVFYKIFLMLVRAHNNISGFGGCKLISESNAL